MKRLRIGVIGAGLIAQVEHIPNLVRLAERFALIGVCDPSPSARDFIKARYGVTACPTIGELIALGLDAVVVASPDALHVEHVLAALEAGLHVFCEKPLCYDPADAARIGAARDRAGRVVQLGYMKRFDPSYEALLELLPDDARGLRYVSVEVGDPDAWPFVGHHPYRRFDDVPTAAIEATRAAQRAQVFAAVGMTLDATHFRGTTGPYCSSLVHDVNAVHGLLDRLGIADGEIAGAQVFAGGGGGAAQIRLLHGHAVWNMVHLAVPGLAEYRERIALYFDDRIFELVFPSPYLNHQPTQLWIHRSTGERFEKTLVRASYQEAFLRELEAFWSAIVEATPVRNTVEHAARDLTLLTRIAAHAQRNSPPSRVPS